MLREERVDANRHQRTDEEEKAGEEAARRGATIDAHFVVFIALQVRVFDQRIGVAAVITGKLLSRKRD